MKTLKKAVETVGKVIDIIIGKGFPAKELRVKPPPYVAFGW